MMMFGLFWVFFRDKDVFFFWLCLSRAVAMYVVAEPRSFYTNSHNLDTDIFLHTQLGTRT